MPGLFDNPTAHLARAGEGDHIHVRVLGEIVSHFRAGPGHEVQNPRRQTGLVEYLAHLRPADARAARRFGDDRVARDQCGGNGAREQGRGEAERADGQHDAARGIGVFVHLAGPVATARSLRQPPHLAGIEPEIVRRLHVVALRLAPGLADLVHHPRGNLEPAISQKFCGRVEDIRTGLRRHGGPARERRAGRGHGGIGGRFVTDRGATHHLGGIRRIQRIPPSPGVHRFVIDDRGIVAAELLPHTGKGIAHRLSIGGSGKIDIRLGFERFHIAFALGILDKRFRQTGG